MSKARIIAWQVPLLILWLMLSALIWSFVFNLITDTDPARKLVLYADTRVPDPTGVAVALEEGRGPGIRMVRVHPFTYALMDGEELTHADLYIMTESDLTAYAAWLAPVPESLRPGETLWTGEDGQPLAIRLTDAYPGLLSRFPARTEESLWLAFGARSLHLTGNEGALDAEAEACAARLLALGDD